MDEVGRGCLAGPVVAAAVILPPTLDLPGLTDSKQLTPHKREAYNLMIREQAVAVSVGSASPEEIDQMNILSATFLAMQRAIDGLRPAPEYLIHARFQPIRPESGGEMDHFPTHDPAAALRTGEEEDRVESEVAQVCLRHLSLCLHISHGADAADEYRRTHPPGVVGSEPLVGGYGDAWLIRIESSDLLHPLLGRGVVLLADIDAHEDV